MRESFPYESNALLLSKYLVPELIDKKSWDDGVNRWTSAGRPYSLLHSLIVEGVLDEAAYLSWMSHVLGCDTDTGPLEDVKKGAHPEGAMLAGNGFLILKRTGRRKLVAGGPDLPPALDKYLGASSGDYQWVLRSPLEAGPKVRVARPAILPDRPELSETAGWLDQLLSLCSVREVADLHLEQSGETLRVRTRCPHGMRELGHWDGVCAGQLMRLIKEWSGLPTAAHYLPADGRLNRRIDGGVRTFRASLIQTVDGESMVFRQLGEESAIRSLEDLQMPAPLRQELKTGILLDPGLILFTGPTGSGKTTTLYAVLSSLKELSLKIMTIEDPVEYELSHASQCVTNASGGWTFAHAIRAFLRQDPDVIVPGEIRDPESAEAACRAAPTGHAVLTTLHAGDAESALQRLRSWGIPKGILQETVRLIINQRLEKPAREDTLRARYSWDRPFGNS